MLSTNKKTRSPLNRSLSSDNKNGSQSLLFSYYNRMSHSTEGDDESYLQEITNLALKSIEFSDTEFTAKQLKTICIALKVADPDKRLLSMIKTLTTKQREQLIQALKDSPTEYPRYEYLLHKLTKIDSSPKMAFKMPS